MTAEAAAMRDGDLDSLMRRQTGKVDLPSQPEHSGNVDLDIIQRRWVIRRHRQFPWPFLSPSSSI